MKILKTIVALLSTILLNGCIAEDWSDCPTTNVELKLTYLGDTNDPTMFGRMVSRAQLFVFDQTGAATQSRVLTQDELASQTVGMELPGGRTYTIICWANAMEGTTSIVPGNMLADYRVQHPAYGTAGRIPTNDHLYWGETIIPVVTDGQIVSGEIRLQGAHNNVEIYVEGFGEENKEISHPLIEVENLMPQYDLQMNSMQAANHTYHPTVELDTEHKMPAAKLQTLLFGDENPVLVVIKDPKKGGELARFNLKDYMTANKLSVDGKNERTIVLLIRFGSDLQITITVPDWESVDMQP